MIEDQEVTVECIVFRSQYGGYLGWIPNHVIFGFYPTLVHVVRGLDRELATYALKTIVVGT